MEQQEVRIPIVGVLEESRLRPTNDHLYANHYPNGDGVYLVKFDDGSRELRSMMSNGMIDDKGRERVVSFNFPIPVQVIAEEIKTEHEASLKDDIETLHTNILRALNACHEDMLRECGVNRSLLDEIKESGLSSCNSISEKTLLEALKVVAGKD